MTTYYSYTSAGLVIHQDSRSFHHPNLLPPHQTRDPQPAHPWYHHSFDPAMMTRTQLATIVGLLDGHIRRGHILVGFDVEQVNHNFSKTLAQGDFLDCGLCVLDTNDISMPPNVNAEYFDHLTQLLHTTYLRDSSPKKLNNRNIDWKLVEMGVRQPGPLQRYPRMAPNTGCVENTWTYHCLPLPVLQDTVRAMIPNRPTTTLIVHDTNLETRLMTSWRHIGRYAWYDTQVGDHEEFQRGRRKLKLLCGEYGVAAEEWDFHNSGYDATFTMRIALRQAFRGAAKHFVDLVAQQQGQQQPVEPFQGTVYYNAAVARPARVGVAE